MPEALLELEVVGNWLAPLWDDVVLFVWNVAVDYFVEGPKAGVYDEFRDFNCL